MTRSLAPILLLSLVLPCWAGEQIEGSGVAATETRQLAEFEEVDFGVSGSFKIEIGEPTPLKIWGDDNILPLIQTEVREGRLIISADKPFSPKNELDFTVTVADLTLARLLGCGDMIVRGLDNECFHAMLNGSGDMQVTGQTGKLNATVNGSGNMQVTAQTGQLNATVHGSGDMQVTAQTGQLDATVHGSGDMQVTGQIGQLDAAVHGSGDVQITGRIGRLNATVHGSGDLKLAGNAEQLALAVHGSGDTSAFNLEAPVATVVVAGSGQVRVNVTESLVVDIAGTGDVSYMGTPDLVKRGSGSGDVRRVHGDPEHGGA